MMLERHRKQQEKAYYDPSHQGRVQLTVQLQFMNSNLYLNEKKFMFALSWATLIVFLIIIFIVIG